MLGGCQNGGKYLVSFSTRKSLGINYITHGDTQNENHHLGVSLEWEMPFLKNNSKLWEPSKVIKWYPKGGGCQL